MNVFNSVKGLHPRRNAFSAHTYRNDFTGSLGQNIPVYIQHVVPGTRVNVSTSALVRLQALIAPIMDNIDYYVHFWKIPYRLLENDEFTKFISSEIDPEDYQGLFATPHDLCEAVETEFPADWSLSKKEAAAAKIFGNGSLLDMCGYDNGLFGGYDPQDPDDHWYQANNTTVLNYRALIAYYMLHVNWYMNENVEYFQDFVSIVDDLVKNPTISVLARLLVLTYDAFGDTFLPHGWEKDYFTSALPNVQFGDPVTLPLGGSAPVSIDTTNVRLMGNNNPLVADGKLVLGFDYIVAQNENPVLISAGTPDQSQAKLYDSDDPEPATLTYLQGDLKHTNGDAISGSADLSEASAITINELRFANALQLFKERQMRFGRRRLEHYKGFFDVSPEDLRLQVPKYLGGGRIPINISDIEQTSASTDTSKQGNLAGKATAVAGGFAGFSTFCSEESILIGIAFAMPHITYAQQVSRFIMKTNDIYDYFNPSFEHLGEQAINKIELFSASTDPEGEFGYTPRYNEYRFHNNEMHGAFKDSLSYWTLGRLFSSQPALNADFVYMQPSVFNRIFAVSNSSPMLVSMLFRQRIVQPVSKYGTPMLLA